MLLLPIASQAENGVKRETVERLLNVLNAEKVIDAMYSQAGNVFANMTAQLGVKESEQEIFNRYMQKLSDAMMEDVSWSKMKEPMIDIYMKHYTEKEIQDLLAFYSTESGKAMIEKMPLVARDSMLMSQSMLEGFMPRLTEIMVEMESELKAARNKASQDQKRSSVGSP